MNHGRKKPPRGNRRASDAPVDGNRIRPEKEVDGNRLHKESFVDGNRLRPEKHVDGNRRRQDSRATSRPKKKAGARLDIYRILEGAWKKAEAGERADVHLSQVFREKKLPPKERLKLIGYSQALFRWRFFLPEALRFSEALDWACLLDGLKTPDKRQVDLRTPLWKAKALPPVEQRLQWLSRQFPGTRIPPVERALPRWLAGGLPADANPVETATALLLPARLWLRTRVPLKKLAAELGEEGGSLRAHASLSDAASIKTKKDLYYTDAYKQGDFVIQDPASQAIGRLCGALPGERWWDACAGAGGKTLQLCDAMDGRGVVIATDTHEGRLRELRRRLAAAGRHNLEARHWQGDRPPKGPAFDGVLVDAPCTNSGTLRRNPDLWIRPDVRLDELNELQARLLNLAASRVKPGGKLVYATCSLLPAENEEVVSAFLERFPEFRPVTIEDPLDGRGTFEGLLTFHPQDGDHDGTFVAVLQKDRNSPEVADDGES